MKLRIESDGTVQGTRILTESGEPVEGVQAISLTCCTGEAPEALLVVQPVQLQLIVDAQANLAPDLQPFAAEDLQVLPEDLKGFFNVD